MGDGGSTVVDRRILARDFVQFLGDEAGDDIGTDGSVVAAIVEESNGKREQRVVGDTVQFRAVDGEVLVAGGNGSDVNQDDPGLVSITVVIVLDERAGEVGSLSGIGDGD